MKEILKGAIECNEEIGFYSVLRGKTLEILSRT